MVDAVSVIGAGLFGSVVAGGVLTAAGLGIACLFGHKNCAYSSDFGDDSYRRDVAVPFAPMLFQVNNTDLSLSTMEKLAGLTANVLDVSGHADFKSDYFDSAPGIMITVNANVTKRSVLLPPGVARGEFSLTLPGSVKPEIEVQGTWTGMDPDVADEKVQIAFNKIHHTARSVHESEPGDVADFFVKFLDAGSDFATSIVEAVDKGKQA